MIELGLVDELRMFRDAVVVGGGGGTPLRPPVTEHRPPDLIETRALRHDDGQES